MEFSIAPAIFTRFPELRVAVVIARGIDSTRAGAAVSEGWHAAWAAAGQDAARYGNAQSHPHVAPWRAAFRAQGISAKNFPSSIEALLRRALKGGEPFSVNPLVDFYNGVSLRHIVPAGGFDLAAVHGPLELRLTRAGDAFTALDSAEPLAVPPGEVAYTDGSTVLTRHFVWRQSRDALLAATTNTALLVSEILGDVPGAARVAAAVLTDLDAGLRACFGAHTAAYLLDARTARIAW
jgi:DNA/RNA-binding domain of Phe-tRNA-synthetase-like protein